MEIKLDGTVMWNCYSIDIGLDRSIDSTDRNAMKGISWKSLHEIKG